MGLMIVSLPCGPVAAGGRRGGGQFCGSARSRAAARRPRWRARHPAGLACRVAPGQGAGRPGQPLLRREREQLVVVLAGESSTVPFARPRPGTHAAAAGARWQATSACHLAAGRKLSLLARDLATPVWPSS